MGIIRLMHPRPTTVPMRPTAGFTLLELMIALVVLGILSAVAFPSFMDSIRKGRRSDAVQALTGVQQAQERRRANQATYTSDITGAAPAGLAMSGTSSSGYYTLTAEGATATAYTVIATAVSGKSQASDSNCVRMRIRIDSGNIFYGSAPASGSWDEAAGNRCWARQ